MSETVYILGAGASAQAGAPLMANFLDTAERLHRLGKAGVKNEYAADFALVFRAVAALQPVYAKGYLDLDNLESVFAAFEMAQLCGGISGLAPDNVNALPDAMRRMITSTLEQEITLLATGRQVEPPVPYRAFAELLRDQLAAAAGSASVITFNYDIALDYAMHFIGLPVTYCIDGASKSVDVMKLHGSLNWVRTEAGDVVPWYLSDFLRHYNWDPVLLMNTPTPVRLTMLPHLEKFAPREGVTPVTEPFIVPPTWNKTQHHLGIAPVWRRAAEHLATADNIIVIGYSLPETDQFFRYLYALGTVGATRLKRFWVFDPDRTGQVERRFAAMLGKAAERRFRIWPETFENGIPMIRRELRIAAR